MLVYCSGDQLKLRKLLQKCTGKEKEISYKYLKGNFKIFIGNIALGLKTSKN